MSWLPRTAVGLKMRKDLLGGKKKTNIKTNTELNVVLLNLKINTLVVSMDGLFILYWGANQTIDTKAWKNND